MATYGVSTALIAGRPFEAALSRIAAAGFTEIELNGEAGSFEGWLADPAGLLRAVQAAGLRARSVHPPPAGWHNADPDPEVRAASLRTVRETLTLAAELGARAVIWHSNYHETAVPPEELRASRERSRENLAAAADRAGRLGLQLACENLPELGNPRPACSVEDNLELIAGLGEGVGLCLDAGHSRSNALSPAAEARQAGAKLFATHLQDNDGPGQDQHLVPQRDMDAWDELARTLDAMGYRGGRMFEVHPDLGAADLDGTLARLSELAKRWG
jgi:sugar phosphate isomerase/epimerase